MRNVRQALYRVNAGRGNNAQDNDGGRRRESNLAQQSAERFGVNGLPFGQQNIGLYLHRTIKADRHNIALQELNYLDQIGDTLLVARWCDESILLAGLRRAHCRRRNI